MGGLPVVLDAGGRVTSLRGTTFTWTKDGTLREVDEPIPALPDPFTRDALTDRVRKIVAESEVAKKGACHMFRHTAATLMLEGGADIRYVQQMLGHSNSYGIRGRSGKRGASRGPRCRSRRGTRR